MKEITVTINEKTLIRIMKNWNKKYADKFKTHEPIDDWVIERCSLSMYHQLKELSNTQRS